MTTALALSIALALLGAPPVHDGPDPAPRPRVIPDQTGQTDSGDDGSGDDGSGDDGSGDDAGAAKGDAEQTPRSAAYAAVLVPVPEAERDEVAAKSLMNAAKLAFKDDRFDEAIELLAEAYRTYPYVTLLYSLGSAHRRAYESSGDAEHQTLSIRRYQQYLSAAPDAEHSDLAQNYLTSLLADRDLGDTELELVTRVLISTTADDAVMIVDDGAPLPAPGVVSVEPGSHHIVVSAPGYFVLERDINVPEGTTYPVQVELEGVPARVIVDGPKGATVRVDGRVIGRLPLNTAVRVKPGEHSVVVTQNGHDAFSKDLDLERDSEVRVRAKLDISKRRFASYFLLGLGSVSIATSAVLSGLAVERQAKALAINRRRLDGQLTLPEYQDYLAVVEERDNIRGAAVITGIAGTALLATGLGLFARDEPKIEVSGELAQLRVAPYFGRTGGGLQASFRF